MLNRRIKALSIGIGITLTFPFVSDVAAAALAGETTPRQTRPLSQSAVSNLTQLIRRLKSRGNKVVRKERIEQPFLSVKGQIIKIDDQDVQVFEYRTIHAAKLDASKISRTGSSIATSKPLWIAPPHFFKSGRLIVLYIGEEPTLLQELRHVLGPQFAGQ